jgi:hypothetical protein
MIKSLSGFDCFPLEMVGVEGKYKKKKVLLVHDQKLQTMIENFEHCVIKIKEQYQKTMGKGIIGLRVYCHTFGKVLLKL